MSAGSTKSVDRRTEILDCAAALFRRYGYSEVGIDDIGRAAGVSGPAIYRHFDGKQELLHHVVTAFITRLNERWSALAEAGVEDAVLPAVVRTALDHPNEYYVHTNQRHLLDDEYAERLDAAKAPIQRAWGALLEAHDIVPGEIRARFRLVTMEGLLLHAALTGKASRSAREAMASEAFAAILALALPTPTDSDRPAESVLCHHNRREAIFAAAIVLFADRGFTAVTLKDIGAEVGVSASAIHRHFESKDSILLAAVQRSADQMRAAIAVAIARSGSAREAVADIARRFSFLFAESRELFGLSFYLATVLPRESAAAVRAERRVNLDEVAHLVTAAVPGVTLAAARVRVGATLSVLNNVARNRQLSTVGNLADMLTAVSTLILLQDAQG